MAVSKGMNGHNGKFEYYMNGRGMMKNRENEEEMMDETSSFGYIPKESD